MKRISNKIRRYDKDGNLEYNIPFIIGLLLTISLVISLLLANVLHGIEATADGTLIHTFNDALWVVWMTMCNVGMGDIYPVTVIGRVMIGFNFLFGAIVTGMLVGLSMSWVVRKLDNKITNREIKMELDVILQRLQHQDCIEKSQCNQDTCIESVLEQHFIDDKNPRTITLGRCQNGNYAVTVHTDTQNFWYNFDDYKEALNQYNKIVK